MVIRSSISQWLSTPTPTPVAVVMLGAKWFPSAKGSPLETGTGKTHKQLSPSPQEHRDGWVPDLKREQTEAPAASATSTALQHAAR